MPLSCTPEQMEIIEEHYRYYTGAKEAGSKTDTLTVSVLTFKFGPMVSSQEIGRYYANRYAAEQGRPRAVRKTAAQLARLKASFEADAYPTVGEQILIVHETGLEAKQVKSWFENERKKRNRAGQEVFSMNPVTDVTDAGKMWRAYKSDPEGYAQRLYDGEICLLTGAEL